MPAGIQHPSISEAGIRANDARIKQAFSWNPGYREYFAVKATPTPAILNIMKDLGSGRYNQGGVGIPYRPDDRANDIFTIANSLMKFFSILEELSEFRLHNHRLSANISTVL